MNRRGFLGSLAALVGAAVVIPRWKEVPPPAPPPRQWVLVGEETANGAPWQRAKDYWDAWENTSDLPIA